MAEKKRGANEPEPRPIIVKKIIVDGHGGHHGGAWKVAYADFVTAMMAIFLLMWLLGATTEKQRKGLADYFTPTLVQTKENSAGSNGMFGGDSMMAKENYPTTGGQDSLAITIPRDASGTKDQGGKAMKAADRQKFESIKKDLEARMARVEARMATVDARVQAKVAAAMARTADVQARVAARQAEIAARFTPERVHQITVDAEAQARAIEEIRKACSTDEAKAVWARQGAEFSNLAGPQFASFISAEIKKWAQVVKASGAKLD